jgi:flagellar hook-basal body complex protein FliE
MTMPIRPAGPIVSPLESGKTGFDLAPGEPSFGDLLKRAVGDVSQAQDDKADIIGSFLRGDPVELHQVMATAEEASLSLQMLVEVRNKLTEAYRSVMNLQV